MIWYRTEIGAIFCQVNSSMPDDNGIPCVTSGIQKWKGDIPSFIAMAIVIMVDGMVLHIFVTVHSPE